MANKNIKSRSNKYNKNSKNQANLKSRSDKYNSKTEKFNNNSNNMKNNAIQMNNVIFDCINTVNFFRRKIFSKTST